MSAPRWLTAEALIAYGVNVHDRASWQRTLGAIRDLPEVKR